MAEMISDSNVLVHTGSLWVWKDDPRTIDTTAKSGVKAFAPTWDMVRDYKEGRLSEERYVAKYLALMRQSFRESRAVWNEILDRDEVILACYCPPGAEFCHRYILAEIFEMLGAGVGMELLGGKQQLTKPIPKLAWPE